MSYKDVQAGAEEVRVGVRVLASTLKQMLLQQEELLVAVAGIDAAYPTVHKGLPIARVLQQQWKGLILGIGQIFRRQDLFQIRQSGLRREWHDLGVLGPRCGQRKRHWVGEISLMIS